MYKEKFKILNYINEGIIIINKELEIVFWNRQMEQILAGTRGPLHGNIYDKIPSLNKPYYRNIIDTVMEGDFKYFLSSAMHKNLLSEEHQYNLKLSQFECDGSKYLIIECIDVSSQIIRINQLKNYARELNSLNKRLMEQEEEIKRLAYYDRLTGLANRTLFYNMSDKILQDAKRNKKKIGLMFIDIDKFKNINDAYGHTVGDKVLKEVAKILEESIRQSDIVARHGGDEFLILLTDCKDYDNYKVIASRIEEANKCILINEDLQIEISLSIGISFYPKDGDNIDQLISKADRAMYKVKNLGGNHCARFYGN